MNKELEKVKNILHLKKASLVVLKDRSIYEYYDHRVKNLVDILSEDEKFLENTTIADAKIGKVALALMIKAGVKQVYTKLISKNALEILNNNIKVVYDKKIDFLPNMDNTDMCPMEKKYKNINDIDQIYNDFIKSNLK